MMEKHINIDVKRQILWYAVYTDLVNKYPNASKQAVVDATNKIVSERYDKKKENMLKLNNKKQAKIAALKALSNMAAIISNDTDFEDSRSNELFNSAIDEICDGLAHRARKLEV